MRKLIMVAALVGLLTGADYLGQARQIRSTRFMGDKFQVTFYDVDASVDTLKGLWQDVCGRLSQLEAKFDTTSADSVAAALKKMPLNTPVETDPDIFEVLHLAQVITKMTDGKFQITDAALRKLWQKAREAQKVPDAAELAGALPKAGEGVYMADPLTKKINFTKCDIDFSWEKIVPGYAVDQAVLLLKKAGVRSAVISYAGIIRVIGNCSEGPLWRIGIEHPRRPEEYAAVFESQEEVALSATEDNADFMKVGQRRIPFVFDPETGSPPAGGGVIGTTVTARHAAVAHALSYAFFVSGPEKSYELAERFKEEGVGAVFFEEGQNDKVLLSASENLRRSLKDIQP